MSDAHNSSAASGGCLLLALLLFLGVLTLAVVTFVVWWRS